MTWKLKALSDLTKLSTDRNDFGPGKCDQAINICANAHGKDTVSTNRLHQINSWYRTTEYTLIPGNEVEVFGLNSTKHRPREKHFDTRWRFWLLPVKVSKTRTALSESLNLNNSTWDSKLRYTRWTWCICAWKQTHTYLVFILYVPASKFCFNIMASPWSRNQAFAYIHRRCISACLDVLCPYFCLNPIMIHRKTYILLFFNSYVFRLLWKWHLNCQILAFYSRSGPKLVSDFAFLGYLM